MPFDFTPPNIPTRVRHIEHDLAILRDARDGISCLEHWGKGERRTLTMGCATDWVMKVTPAMSERGYLPVVTRLYEALPRSWRLGHVSPWNAVIAFNDTSWRRHRRIVKMFDDAIARAEEDLSLACGTLVPRADDTISVCSRENVLCR